MIIKSGSKIDETALSETEVQMVFRQHEMVRDFFRRDDSAEIVNSLNTMIESFLFSEDLENVTSEMRIHIANHLRVVTLISKLGETVVKL